MPRSEDSQASWLAKPLCRRYVTSVFEATAVRCRDGDTVGRQEIEWAFGWLPDGECEPLGAWLRSAPESDHEAAVVVDLRSRGVERLWVVVGAGRTGLAAAMGGRTTGASVDGIVAGPTGETGHLGSPFPAVVTGQIRDRLQRAVRRHGVFESSAKALDFIAVALQRAERRLDEERSVAAQQRRLAANAPMASLSA